MALNALREARACADAKEAGYMAGPLLEAAPETRAFDRLTEMAPEVRLKLFDELVNCFKETDAKAVVRRNALGLATGYLATVVAGGSASLALVGKFADKFPELTGWAYVIGALAKE